MKKIIVEVGSTCVKVDLYDGLRVRRLKEITIFFKKNYQELKKIKPNDIKALIRVISDLQKKYDDIYVAGTSIFRTIPEEELTEFKNTIKEATGCEFNVISAEEECNLTVAGATVGLNLKACVMIGGGGSTEIAVYDGKITDTTLNPIGVMDVMKLYPDLANDYASTSLEKVMEYIKANLDVPKTKADILILAGGAHEKFIREAGLNFTENTIFQSPVAPIMMDVLLRKKETKRFFNEISLKKIKENSDDPNWWEATRAMCAFVLVVAEAIDAKYIIPTNVGMVYGIIKSQQK